ncbi:hypothetical protein BLOT_005544 [Blomia tropicalis]|nr:hypothetical protein BLOT_005544 [Blomia tropicalis]
MTPRNYTKPNGNDPEKMTMNSMASPLSNCGHGVARVGVLDQNETRPEVCIMCMYIRLPVVLLCSAPSMLKILLVSLDEGDRMETKHFVHRCRTTTTQPSEQENLIDSNTTHKHSHIVVMNVKNKK